MPKIHSIVIHCHDPYLLAPFWSMATGLPVHPDDVKALAAHTLEEDESVLLGSRDGLHVWITPAEELKPPGRIHLDVTGADGELRTLLKAGATVARELPHWTVLSDPEGNEFCFVPAVAHSGSSTM
ncbi:VOC family protein [Kribbella turkmenica]|uniref:VOC family protein n=1 Tax=Kribbella turkmenica TaxID=2530375 RepID=A0A4R4X0Z9_9ACTN|nr:VOC family protein [Kribbella turkmenica]TDD23792.1 VOC family protein [Kribbella turkmenica]